MDKPGYFFDFNLNKRFGISKRSLVFINFFVPKLRQYIPALINCLYLGFSLKLNSFFPLFSTIPKGKCNSLLLQTIVANPLLSS